MRGQVEESFVRDYAIQFLDALGRSQPSEHHRFMDDDAAKIFAHDSLLRSHFVEVWRGKECVIRLERGAHAPDLSSAAATPVRIKEAPTASKAVAPVIVTHRHPQPLK